jgi:hypothetical protein
LNGFPIASAFVLIVGHFALELIHAEYGNILRLIAPIETTRDNFESVFVCGPNLEHS